MMLLGELTADEKQAIADYTGASSQILALFLFNRRSHDSWFASAGDEMSEFNEFLAAVRAERGR